MNSFPFALFTSAGGNWMAGSFALAAAAGGLCWLLARVAGSDAQVRWLANLLPPLAIGGCLFVFFLVPPGAPPPALAIRALHYAGVALLFGFLVFGTICQLRIWRQMDSAVEVPELLTSYRRWWVATRLAPAPAALMILLSGLRLTYECPGLDVSQVAWLQWLVIAFSGLFFDGLLAYLPEICRRYRVAGRLGSSAEPGGARFQALRDRWGEATLLLHALSFPFVLGLALWRPSELPRPFHFLSGYFVDFSLGTSQALRALAVVVSVGLLLIPLRLPGALRRDPQS